MSRLVKTSVFSQSYQTKIHVQTANRNHHQPHHLSTTQNAVHDYHLSLEMQLNKES